MDSRHGLLVKFDAVVRGYHVFRSNMIEYSTYICLPDPTNCFDSKAVLIKCLETGKPIGHVPVTPEKINCAILQILDLDPSIAVYCKAIDKPQRSKESWPAPEQKGGGAVIPVIYSISAPNHFEQTIVDILLNATSKHQAIFRIKSINVERSGEETPPLVLSTTPGYPDTPNYKNYTP